MNMIAEGYYATNAFMKLIAVQHQDCRLQVLFYRVLYEKISPRMEMRLLADQLS